MSHPFMLHTQRALAVFGELIRTWTIDPASRPDHSAEFGNRILVVDAKDLRDILIDGHGLTEDADRGKGDFIIRHGVEQIELILRDPTGVRATFLMPEVEVMQAQIASTDGVTAEVPAFYFTDPVRGRVPDDAGRQSPAFVPVTMPGNEDPMRAFLDPYLASYLCMQCG
ncbi:MAG: hypothetical protein AAGA05_00875 [Pseudomonadota bacterium]